MSNPSPAPSSPRVSSGTRRLFPLAALVIAGASLAVGCSSDDTTPEAKASSTEVTAESGGTEASVGDLKISYARIGEPAGQADPVCVLGERSEAAQRDDLVGLLVAVISHGA